MLNFRQTGQGQLLLFVCVCKCCCCCCRVCTVQGVSELIMFVYHHLECLCVGSFKRASLLKINFHFNVILWLHTLSEKINLLSNLARENYSLPEAQTRNSVIHKQKVLKIKYIFFYKWNKNNFWKCESRCQRSPGVSYIYPRPSAYKIQYEYIYMYCIYRQINSNCRS